MCLAVSIFHKAVSQSQFFAKLRKSQSTDLFGAF